MISPLKSTTVTSAFGVVRVGSGLPDSNGTNRHIGVDLRASVGTAVYAPTAGVVTVIDDVGLKLVEIRASSDKKLHRFLHLSKNILSVGQSVKQDQLIGYSGDTGGVAAHLHWDVRIPGTAWNASYYNYQDPMKLIGEEEMAKITKQIEDRLFKLSKNTLPDQDTYKYPWTQKECTPDNVAAMLVEHLNRSRTVGVIAENEALKAGITKDAALKYVQEHLT